MGQDGSSGLTVRLSQAFEFLARLDETEFQQV